MWEHIAPILQWLIPSGGVGAVLVWLTNKTIRNLRTSKEVHDTYKTMYLDVQQTLNDIQDEKKKLYKMVSRFERALSRCFSCRYHDKCPAIIELQKHKADLTGTLAGFTHDKRKTDCRARDDPGEPGDASDPDGRPP